MEDEPRRLVTRLTVLEVLLGSVEAITEKKAEGGTDLLAMSKRVVNWSVSSGRAVG